MTRAILPSRVGSLDPGLRLDQTGLGIVLCERLRLLARALSRVRAEIARARSVSRIGATSFAAPRAPWSAIDAFAPLRMIDARGPIGALVSLPPISAAAPSAPPPAAPGSARAGRTTLAPLGLLRGAIPTLGSGLVHRANMLSGRAWVFFRTAPRRLVARVGVADRAEGQ